MAPAMQPAEAPRGEPAPAPKKTQLNAPAKLLVELPANAKFYVDDQLMKTSSANRTFNTPTLQAGQTYFYVVRAEVVLDGKTHQETKRILVRSGETVRASFAELERTLAAVATAPPVADTGDDQEP